MSEAASTDDAATDEPDGEAPEEVVEVETLYGAPVDAPLGQTVLHPSVDEYVATVTAAKDDGYVLLADITATDYLTHPGRTLPPGVTAERFEVVVNLVDPMQRRRIRLRVQVPESNTMLPSLYPYYPGSDAAEREVFDMFGIRFDGHPDPTRILMPEDWDGHPLRKDDAPGRIPVQFKSASNVR